MSIVSIKSTPEEFINAKVEALQAEYDLGDTQETYYKDALNEGSITEAQFQEASKWIPNRQELDAIQGNLTVLKRQRKFIEDDLAEVPPPQNPHLDDAYISLMIARIESACSKAPKSGTIINSQKLKANVLEYYAGSRTTEDSQIEEYCMLTGWYAPLPKTPVKAAHLVPRSLEGEDLNYLFGITGGEQVLSSPENSLLLHKNIEEALDSSEIVFLPVIDQGMAIDWKLMVIDQSKLKKSITERYKWGDLHGKCLQFLNNNRPAKRYLYFRYVLSYLINKKRDPSSVEWAIDKNTKGYMWATPGPYLRNSLLHSLARRISDHYLPEALFQQTTFSDLPYARNKNQADEQQYITTLAHKIGLLDKKASIAPADRNQKFENDKAAA